MVYFNEMAVCTQVSFDVGNYPVSTMYSFEQLADGREHTAELLVERQNFTLRVDGGRARSIINAGDKDHLRLTSALFVGGVPAEVGVAAFTNWHLRNLTSFSGCLRFVYINHKPLDFGNAHRLHKVTPGCALEDEQLEHLREQPSDKSRSLLLLDLARPHFETLVIDADFFGFAALRGRRPSWRRQRRALRVRRRGAPATGAAMASASLAVAAGATRATATKPTPASTATKVRTSF